MKTKSEHTFEQRAFETMNKASHSKTANIAEGLETRPILYILECSSTNSKLAQSSKVIA